MHSVIDPNIDRVGSFSTSEKTVAIITHRSGQYV